MRMLDDARHMMSMYMCRQVCSDAEFSSANETGALFLQDSLFLANATERATGVVQVTSDRVLTR